jgi:hypothetical protein
MALSKAQRSLWEKVRNVGNSEQAVPLTEGMAAYLVARIAEDLGLAELFPDLCQGLPAFFSTKPAQLSLNVQVALPMFEKLVGRVADADTYFACIATLQKARLKYDKILSTQPLPTLEQVGPRCLLQAGQMPGAGLVGFLRWRKWFFDIDNRAGQETGYLFEPIIAHALGGTPASAKKSPVKRQEDPSKGRQVDCFLDNRAYEIKMRVTIAASGQGRWSEELSFPGDCRASGFVPVLVCFDGTPNPKLAALVKMFEIEGGQVFVGDAAWAHLKEVAGQTMSRFIELYVRTPIEELLTSATNRPPDLIAHWGEDSIEIRVGDTQLTIDRSVQVAPVTEGNDLIPDDLSDGPEM